MPKKKYFTEEEVKEAKRKQSRNLYIANKEKYLLKNKQWYLNNKERYNELKKDWNEKNPEKLTEYRQRCYIKQRTGFLFHNARRSAASRGLEFSITRDDIIIPETCPYFNVPLTNERDKSNFIPSIDRINNTIGYRKDNIQVISWLANQMKGRATPEQLIAFAKGVLRIHDRTSSNQVSS